ncbi:MAG: septal ring lytic transglycosylase RlpA family protein [Sphingopyxis sp.]|nr:septal ring lytic transglycosylase RlpA family protein [Sphingopyxis sp.]
MKSIVKNSALWAGSALILTGCGGIDGRGEGRPVAAAPPTEAATGVSDTPVKIGEPYMIGGVTFTPADIADYDDVGYASWYGDELAGRPTANGETFNPDAISAAHKTLPLPSYVEVTALDTGRTILVRVNDRGPMAADRLIDLSRGAAEQLGLTEGLSAVRVRRTSPPAAERAQLRVGRPVPERIGTPDSLLSILRTKLRALPTPKSTEAAAVTNQPAAPVASGKAKPGDDRMEVRGAAPAKAAPPAAPVAGGKFAVQVGAFSSEDRANAAAKTVGGTVSAAGKLWRVRMGPFASEAEARTALGQARAKGFRDAMLQRER